MPKRRAIHDSESQDFVCSDEDSEPYESKSRKKSRIATASHGKSVRPKKNSISIVPDGVDGERPLRELQHAHSHAVSTHRISSPEPLRQALLGWYSGVHESRGMPWRKPYNPSFDVDEQAQRAYEVWISEIMLQQTQVATVIPYYNTWMARFPTIKDLASSDIDTVNALWKGLGYYSRAARLLAGAKKAIEELGGRLPTNARDMEAKIPGIGRYSAGAICSIAYNECVPVLDGNVHRLLSRVLALHAPPKAKSTLDVLWRGASAIVKGSDRAGDVNQALIELGSTVCKVRDPDCQHCPLQQSCRAYQYQHINHKGPSTNGSDDVPDIEELCSLCESLLPGSAVTAYPMKAERKKAREELDVVNVVEWRHHNTKDRWFLLVRRPEGGLLAGLHEFPTSANVSGTLSVSALEKITNAKLSELLESPPQPFTRTAKARKVRSEEASEQTDTDGLRIVDMKPAGDVIHIFSHIKKTYRVHWVLLEGRGGPEPPVLRTTPIAGGISQQEQAKSDGDGRPEGRKSAKAKMAKNGRSSLDTKSLFPMSAWVRMEDVLDANIGTGVVKVWKQVCKLWNDG